MSVKSTVIKRLVALSCAFALLLGVVNTNAYTEEGEVVSFNKATVKEIMSIEGLDISESLAKSIVEYREKSGPFKDPTDLLNVPGMTDDLYEEINPVLSDDGDVVFDPEAEPVLAPSKC